MEHSQTIESLNWKSGTSVFLMVFAPVLLVALLLSAIGGRKVIAIAFLVGVFVIPIGVILLQQLFKVTASWDRHVLRVDGGLCSIEVSARELRLDEARLVRDPKIGGRTNGVGLPGLRLGWFRHAGRFAFLAVTKSECVYVPGANFDVLFSPEDPASFVACLRQAAAKRCPNASS